MFKQSKLLIVLTLILAIAVAMVGFTWGGKSEEVKITLAGSTSVQPLAEELGKAYESKHKGVRVFVQGGGSGAGVKAAITGTANVGMCSRELKDSEKGKGLKEITIAKDGIAVIVHKTNKVAGLSMVQIRDIYAGKITNWKQVGGENKKITIVAREAGSGTRGAFEEIVMHEQKIVNKVITQNSTGAVHQTVALDPTAIGFISLGNLDSRVKALKVNGVYPTKTTVKNHSYKISRPFLFLTKGAPKGEAAKFIFWVNGAEGQKIVAKEFISVNR